MRRHHTTAYEPAAPTIVEEGATLLSPNRTTTTALPCVSRPDFPARFGLDHHGRGPHRGPDPRLAEGRPDEKLKVLSL